MSDMRILQLSDLAEIQNLEKKILENSMYGQQQDENEREMLSWHASWRQESLEHYLPLGWSFGIWREGRLVGYFIAQPQLFVRAMTQTLWVERLMAESPSEVSNLVDLVYRLCREKHFQKAVFNLEPEQDLANLQYQLKPVSDNLVELKTAKF